MGGNSVGVGTTKDETFIQRHKHQHRKQLCELCSTGGDKRQRHKRGIAPPQPLSSTQVPAYCKLQMRMLSVQPEDGVRKRRVGNHAPRKSCSALHDKAHLYRFSSLMVCCGHNLRFAAVASSRDWASSKQDGSPVRESICVKPHP